MQTRFIVADAMRLASKSVRIEVRVTYRLYYAVICRCVYAVDKRRVAAVEAQFGGDYYAEELE